MPQLETPNESKSYSWFFTGLGLLLPLIGVGTALYGCFKFVLGDIAGLYWIGAGVAFIIADMVIDTIWPRASRDADNGVEGD